MGLHIRLWFSCMLKLHKDPLNLLMLNPVFECKIYCVHPKFFWCHLTSPSSDKKYLFVFWYFSVIVFWLELINFRSFLISTSNLKIGPKILDSNSYLDFISVIEMLCISSISSLLCAYHISTDIYILWLLWIVTSYLLFFVCLGLRAII